MRERTVQVTFGGFEVGRGVRQEALRVHRGADRGRVVPGKHACLQLADPIEHVDKCQIAVAGQMELSLTLVISLVIQPPEGRG